MTQAGKQPNVKLIPSDPMTNSILIIYCVSSTGASVPFKSQWRRINKKRNIVQQISTHNGTSYRCSPIDIDCFVQVTITFPFQNMQMQKIVQSNIVKVSRQLKQRRNYLKQPIIGKITIDEVFFEARIYIQDDFLHFVTNNRAIKIHIRDTMPEAENNQNNFRLYFKHRPEEFMHHLSQIVNLQLQFKHGFLLFNFATDFHRDIILLGIAEVLLTTTNVRSSKPQNAYISSKTPQKQQGKAEQTEKQRYSQNKSQNSLSPAQRQKIKINEKNIMKKSFTNLNKQANNDHHHNRELQTSFTMRNNAKEKQRLREKEKQKQRQRQKEREKEKERKERQKAKNKQREYLNVFEDEQDLQFLNYNPKLQQTKKTVPSHPKAVLQSSSDQPAINLRDSFEQLQKSFSNVNEQMLDKMFNNSRPQVYRLEQQTAILRKQNEMLKKQAEMAAVLSKENNNLKRKYHELKEQVSRLQIERKVILTDKIRCQVNWHKQLQEKEALKKQLEGFKDLVKNSYHFGNNNSSGNNNNSNSSNMSQNMMHVANSNNNQMSPGVNIRGSGNMQFMMSMRESGNGMNLNHLNMSGNGLAYNSMLSGFATQKQLSPQNERLKNNSYYQMSAVTERKIDNQIRNRSPNSSFYQNP